MENCFSQFFHHPTPWLKYKNNLTTVIKIISTEILDLPQCKWECLFKHVQFRSAPLVTQMFLCNIKSTYWIRWVKGRNILPESRNVMSLELTNIILTQILIQQREGERQVRRHIIVVTHDRQMPSINHISSLSIFRKMIIGKKRLSSMDYWLQK